MTVAVPSVRPLGPADHRPSIRVLARAFFDDPMTRSLFPDPRLRPFQTRGFFGGVLRDCRRHGTIDVARDRDRIVGVAAWLPPGRHRHSWPRRVRMLAHSLGALLSPHRLPAQLAVVAATERRHPDDGLHWYLASIGVEPELQGRGVGGALLRPVLEHLDRVGRPAYLETQTLANVAWYRHHGFEVVDTIDVRPDVPTLWTMWRDPR